MHSTSYALAFLDADPVAMAEQQRWLVGKPEYETLGWRLPPILKRTSAIYAMHEN